MTTGIAIETSERAWITTAATGLLAFLCLLALFWPEAVGVYRVWVGSTAYNHGFLVAPLVAYMIWDRREVLRETAPAPQFWWLLLMPALSALWLASASLGIHEAQQLVVATMLQVILVSLLGWTAYKRLLAPLLYLYFLVPSGEVLVPYLQDFTARMTVYGLQLVGVPVFSDGVFIEIPAGRFVIAEECAGLRFLIASVAFGVFFAVITYRSYLRRVIFIALSIGVPVIANGLRAFGIVYAAELVGSPTAVMADHVIYGWGFFSAILMLLILLGRSFADRPASLGVPQDEPTARPILGRSLVVFLLAMILAALGPAYAATLGNASMIDIVARAEAPRVDPPWTELEGAQPDDWSPIVYGADRTFRDVWTDGQATVYRFVALYVAHGRVNNLIRSENRVANGSPWRIASRSGAISLPGNAQRVDAAEVVSGTRRRLVLSYYVVDGVATASVLGAKLYQLRDLFTSRTHISAFVAIAIDMPDQSQSPTEAAARFLEAMRRFPDDLTKLSQR